MAGNSVVLRAVLTGTSAGQVRAFNESAAAAEMSSARVVKAGSHAASEFSSAFEKHTSLVGGSFGRLGKIGATFGLPFSESLDKIAHKLDVAKAKGEGFSATMSAIGGLTLGVGAAGFIAVGAESIHLADQLHTVHAGLETAVKNSGVAFENFAPFVEKADAKMAKLGFTNTDVEDGLAKLTTATNSPVAALGKLDLAADMARMKHISLTDAASMQVKILAGNTRGIAQWGLNLDLVSGKMHSVQSAQNEVAKATKALANVQADISSGHYKGAVAANKLADAHAAVASATSKYKQTIESIPKVLEALAQRTHGAAEEFGKTFPGELQVAQAELHNLATAFGTTLTDDIQHAEVKVAEIIRWFERNKDVAETLGWTITTVLGFAVATFAKNTAVSLVGGVGRMVVSLLGLGGTAATTAAEVAGSSAAIEAGNAGLMASFAALTAAVEANTVAVGGSLGALVAEVQTASGLIVVGNAEASASFAALLVAAGVAGAELATAEAAMVASTEGAAAAIDVAIGSTGVGLALIALSVGIERAATHWDTEWGNIKKYTTAGVNAVIDTINLLSTVHVPFLGNFHPFGEIKHVGEEKPTPGFDSRPVPIVDAFGNVTGTRVPIDPRVTAIDKANDEKARKKADKEQKDLDAYLHALAALQGNGNQATTPPGPGPAHVPLPPSGSGSMPKAQRDALNRAADKVDLPLLASMKGPTDLLGQAPTVKALQGELTPVHKAALDAMVAKLNATHDLAMERLGSKLEGDWKSAQDKLQAIIDSDITAGQNELVKLQGAITSDSMNGLKGAVTGEAGVKFQQLITALVGVHTAAGDDMVKQLRAEFKNAQDQLVTDQRIEGLKANADLLKVHSDALADQTKAIEDASRSQTQAITDAASVMSSSMQSAAQAMGDAARVASDAANRQAESITDATNTAHNEAMARAQAISDASQIVVDTMGMQGLYGLNLVAQQQTVALDQMKQGFNQQVAAAQHSIDLVTANNHATVAQAQQALDAAVGIQNTLVAQAQGHAAQVAQQSNAVVAGSLAALDQTQAHANAVIANAADQAAFSHAKGTANQAKEADAKLALAQAQQAMIVGQSEAAYSQANNAAAAANAQAQASLQAATDQANQIKAAADAALAAAQGNAAIVIAQAQQALSQASDQAAVAEAQQQAEIAKTRAASQNQFGGSGLVVNITGINPSNALAIAEEISWVYRTQVANVG